MHGASPATVFSSPELLRTDHGGVTTLTLNRPDAYNALSVSLLAALQSAIYDIGRDPRVRVVVIAGAGKAFCAGHDLKEMRAQSGDDAFAEDAFSRCSQLMLSISRLPQPVIARVHGFAFAAGCQLVAQCDLAVASTNAQFATSGVKFGLFCSTPGVALARSVGRKQAMEMLLTGEPIDAETARERGLVNRVVASEALDAEIERLTRAIVEKTPVAIASGKRTFYEQLEMGLADAYILATQAMVANMSTEDAAEGIDAFTARRKPQWKNR